MARRPTAGSFLCPASAPSAWDEFDTIYGVPHDDSKDTGHRQRRDRRIDTLSGLQMPGAT